MKRIEHRVLVALLAMSVGACTTTGMGDDTARISGTSGTSGSPSASDSSYGSPETAGSATGSTSTAQGTTQSGTMASTPNSTVTSIEVIPRQSGDSATGAGTVAGAAVGGTTGGTTGDRVYRITLRMDDGTVQTITQEVTPSFATGDRVQLSSGVIVP